MWWVLGHPRVWICILSLFIFRITRETGEHQHCLKTTFSIRWLHRYEHAVKRTRSILCILLTTCPSLQVLALPPHSPNTSAHCTQKMMKQCTLTNLLENSGKVWTYPMLSGILLYPEKSHTVPGRNAFRRKLSTCSIASKGFNSAPAIDETARR